MQKAINLEVAVQGEQLQEVKKEVGEAEINTKGAKQELDKNNENTRKGGKRLLFVFLGVLLLVLILIIIISIKWRR